MEDSKLKLVLCCFIACILFIDVNGENPYRYITWKVTYGDIYPLGVKQQVTYLPSFFLSFFHVFWFLFRGIICAFWVCLLLVSQSDLAWQVADLLCLSNGLECCSVLQGILINGQFPGPQIDAVTNDNLIISVYNYLNEPFLISW